MTRIRQALDSIEGSQHFLNNRLNLLIEILTAIPVLTWLLPRKLLVTGDGTYLISTSEDSTACNHRGLSPVRATVLLHCHIHLVHIILTSFNAPYLSHEKSDVVTRWPFNSPNICSFFPKSLETAR